jgi:hypothetical protein
MGEGDRQARQLQNRRDSGGFQRWRGQQAEGGCSSELEKKQGRQGGQSGGDGPGHFNKMVRRGRQRKGRSCGVATRWRGNREGPWAQPVSAGIVALTCGAIE